MEVWLARVLRVSREALVRPLARRLPVWMTPNVLSAVRLFFVLPIFLCIRQERWWAALLLYLVAALTDALDGEVARVRGTTTTLGARLDPSVDKVLHITIYVLFLPFAPFLLGTLIVLDAALLLVGAAIVAVRTPPGLPLGANAYGKWKFILQATGVVLLFLERLFPSPFLATAFRSVLALAVIAAMLSLLGYTRPLLRRR
jgi:phosphatidylglycerophosphate synthase